MAGAGAEVEGGRESEAEGVPLTMGTFWVFGVRGGARACWVGCVSAGWVGGGDTVIT